MPRRDALLYDASGKAIRPRAAGWDASGSGIRNRGWTATSASINSILAADLDLLRPRSRDEIRRNPWAAKPVESWVANMIGTGIRPKPRTDDEALREEILELWSDWIDECDADGMNNFYGQQALAVRAAKEGGDCFARLRYRRFDDGLSVPLQIQLFEAEQCDATKNEARADGNVVRAGVEFDRLGRRTAYWMFKTHPGEMIRPFAESMVSVPVPADQVLHVYQVLRPGQVRGYPGLATVLALLHDIREVDDAYVLRQKLQNAFATFEKVSDEGLSALDDDDVELDSDGVPAPILKPGSHIVLPPGHEITNSQPPQDAGHQAEFLKTKLRAAAAGTGVLYEHVSGDYAGVTFSSIRAALVQFRRELEQLQRNMVIFQFCRPVWKAWMQAALLSGAIQIPRENASATIRRLMRPIWQTPGWEYVEPEADIRAAVRRIRAGLSSREIEAAKLGVDVEELDRRIAAENARADELGHIFDSDPRRVTFSGVAQNPGSAAAGDPNADLDPAKPIDPNTGEPKQGGEEAA